MQLYSFVNHGRHFYYTGDIPPEFYKKIDELANSFKPTGTDKDAEKFSELVKLHLNISLKPIKFERIFRNYQIPETTTF